MKIEKKNQGQYLFNFQDSALFPFPPIFFLSFFFLSPVYAQVVPPSAKSGIVEKKLDLHPLEIDGRKKASNEIINNSRELIKKYDSEDRSVLKKIDISLSEASTLTEKFLVNSLQIDGNTVLSSTYLKKIAAWYEGRELSVKELQEACRRIAQAYRKRGYFLVKVYLPEQEINEGNVRINILEGLCGKIMAEGVKEYRQKFISRNFHPDRKGVINYSRMLKSLLILNEYPWLKIKAVIEKGREFNVADILLKAEEKRQIRIIADFNNEGSRYVSRNRLGGALLYNNFVTTADEAILRGVVGVPISALASGSIQYSIPVNNYGTRATLAYQWNDFDVQREFRSLDAAGNSQSGGLKLTHPLVRSRSVNVNTIFNYEYKTVKNFFLGSVSSKDEISLFTAGVNGSMTDATNGRNFFSAVLFFGNNKAKGSPSRTGSEGDFIKSVFELSRFQSFFLGSYLFFKGNMQVTTKELPNVEQFSIGGANTVRGYPQSEYLGDYGYVTTVELRIPPPFFSECKAWKLNRKFKDFIQFVGFLDHGNVHLVSPLAGESKKNEITGAGLGLRVDFGNNFNVKMDVGFPVGGPPPSDGSRSSVHFYVIKKFLF